MAKRADYGEGAELVRLLLVMSGMSPIFILWAVRGTTLISQWHFAAVCLLLFVFFNLVLLMIVLEARINGGVRQIQVQDSEDRRQDVVSYLFAMLLPFYTADLNSARSLLATLLAFGLIVLLFWGLDLHYLNVWIVVFGYHCLQVKSPDNETVRSGAHSFMLITRKRSLRPGEAIRAHMISGTVAVEVDYEEEESDEEDGPGV